MKDFEKYVIKTSIVATSIHNNRDEVSTPLSKSLNLLNESNIQRLDFK